MDGVSWGASVLDSVTLPLEPDQLTLVKRPVRQCCSQGRGRGNVPGVALNLSVSPDNSQCGENDG